ncbi:hypothetical protein RB195_007718 [Necator americanus]|uniref:Uncharacterized protein n=1 Tax=Necator americanus TaxID=51031 RepID=A0ABR1C050_NECAM
MIGGGGGDGDGDGDGMQPPRGRSLDDEDSKTLRYDCFAAAATVAAEHRRRNDAKHSRKARDVTTTRLLMTVRFAFGDNLVLVSLVP